MYIYMVCVIESLWTHDFVGTEKDPSGSERTPEHLSMVATYME